MSSPGSIMSAMSPYTEFSLSPDSPAQGSRFQSISARSSGESSLHPHSVDRRSSPAALSAFSPSDMVGPSPVTSNGTDTTEIEDEDNGEVEVLQLPLIQSEATPSPATQLQRLSTVVPEHLRTSINDESTSVIHAPEGYQRFDNFPAQPTSRHLEKSPPTRSPPFQLSPPPVPTTPPKTQDRSTPIPYQIEDIVPHSMKSVLDVPKDESGQPVSPPPISTNIPPSKYSIEDATPRAHTRQEVEAFGLERSPSRASSSLHSLEEIPEEEQREEEEFEANIIHVQAHEIEALKMALNECWTLCNTLASLSSIHRERIFSYSGTGDAHEQAWKCCWKLCQKLYDSRDEDNDSFVKPTLDMCRDFCQALFDVRQRKDETADSVLRVSFELNNHLYNTHDRSLPEAFRERTLDFYITLCHRLMKQRNELAEETDALLRACWSLAEMLFSLRQNKRDGKSADEELLGSAVQACWELCDLFREGWTQVRPERGTPRASQTTFSQIGDQMSRSRDASSHASSHSKSSSLSSLPENPEHPPHARTLFRDNPTPGWNPETPTTEFEDTPISPDASPNIPNILVLGTDNSRSVRWSSASSSLSGYSQGSNKSAHSNSTITSNANPEDVNLTRLKILILKAAMNVGFSRTTPTSSGPNKGDPPALQTFVKALPTGSFGSLPSHASLLSSYRSLVLSDPTFRSSHSLPGIGKKASAIDVAKSVGWMMRSGQYTFLKDLFRMVFGFHLEEAEKRKNVSISV